MTRYCLSLDGARFEARFRYHWEARLNRWLTTRLMWWFYRHDPQLREMIGHLEIETVHE